MDVKSAVMLLVARCRGELSCSQLDAASSYAAHARNSLRTCNFAVANLQIGKTGEIELRRR